MNWGHVNWGHLNAWIEVHLAMCTARARAMREMSGRDAGVERRQAIGTGVVIHFAGQHPALCLQGRQHAHDKLLLFGHKRYQDICIY